MSPRLASGTIATSPIDVLPIPATPATPAVLDLRLHCADSSTGDLDRAGAGPRHATVTWTTTSPVAAPQVHLGPGHTGRTAASTAVYTTVVPARTIRTVDPVTQEVRYQHRARLTRLQPDAVYTLMVSFAGKPSLRSSFRLSSQQVAGNAAGGPIRLREEGSQLREQGSVLLDERSVLPEPSMVVANR